jgi:hypothetical protein
LCRGIIEFKCGYQPTNNSVKNDNGDPLADSHILNMWKSYFSLLSSYCGAPSLTRGWVCNLLVQFSVTLGPKSRRTHGHILLSHLRLSNLEGQVPVFISQGTGWSSCTLRHRVPFCYLFPHAWLRWRYSNPHKHGCILKRKFKLFCDRRSVGQFDLNNTRRCSDV